MTVSLLTLQASDEQAVAAPVEPGFQEIVLSGLNRPTNLEFASDGRVFVSEQRGVIKVFNSLADPTPTVFADLRHVVHDVWDRGLLGMTLHPNFPDEPWVYVLYTYDTPPGETAPYWNDGCNSVSGGSNGGRCIVTAQLPKLQAAGNEMTGDEQILIYDWCQQYASHSTGNVQFGADGALYGLRTFAYRHNLQVGTGCPTDSSSITGLAFYPEGERAVPERIPRCAIRGRRQCTRRDHDRAAQDRMHPSRLAIPHRPTDPARRRRTDHRRVGGLVQLPAAHAPPRPTSPSRRANNYYDQHNRDG